MLEGISAKIDKLNIIITSKTTDTEKITDDARQGA